MKRFLKKRIYGLLTPRLLARARRAHAGIALCYHRFEAAPGLDPMPGMPIDPDRFRMHLDTLAPLGRFVSLEAFLTEPCEEGLRFCLTFDDGYRDNLTLLLPLLEEREIPATIFPVAGLFDGSVRHLPHDRALGHAPAMLTVDDLRALARHPLIGLGGHTFTHPRLRDLSPSELRHELRESKVLLEAIIGRPILDFAAPYGQPRDADWVLTAELLAQEGYRTLCGNSGGWNVPGLLAQGGFCRINRVSMSAIAEPWNVEAWVLAQAMGPGKGRG